MVVGAGPVGLLNAILLKERGSEVFLSEVNQGRLKLAETFDVGRILDASSTDVGGEVKKATQGMGVDLAIVASGSAAAAAQALRSVRKGGTACLFGVPQEGATFSQSLSSVYNSELSIVPSYGATETETREALAILSERPAEYRRLLTHRFPIAEFSQAVEVASRGEGCKVVVIP